MIDTHPLIRWLLALFLLSFVLTIVYLIPTAVSGLFEVIL